MNNDEQSHKQCIACHKCLNGEEKYICADCYNKALKRLENNELYNKLKKENCSEDVTFLILILDMLTNGDKKNE